MKRECTARKQKLRGDQLEDGLVQVGLELASRPVCTAQRSTPIQLSSSCTCTPMPGIQVPLLWSIIPQILAAEEPHETHTGEKLFPCNQCSKASAGMGNLGAHTQTDPLQRRAVLLWLVGRVFHIGGLPDKTQGVCSHEEEKV